MSGSADRSIEVAFPAAPYMVMGPDEDLFSAMRRMALEQLEVMIAGFVVQEDAARFDHDLHSARKAGKRLRALLRLFRDDLGRDVFRSANDVVRDQGRKLAAARAARVLRITVAELVASGAIPAQDVAALEQALARRHVGALGDLRDDEAGRADGRSALAELAEGIRCVVAPLGHDAQALAAVEPALARSYRNARRHMRRAMEVDSHHEFHEWRKRVNRLRYQLEALSGAYRKPVADLVDILDELSEMLGTEHDLADLAAACDAVPDVVPPQLWSLLGHRSHSLRERALGAGDVVFASKPGSFRLFVAEQRLRSPLQTEGGGV